MTLTKRGFTLVELLVVVAMIAVIMGAVTTSVSASRERARVQKAGVEVRAIAQAILGFENFDTGDEKTELPGLTDADADMSSIGFILGSGGTSQTGEKIPVLLMASLTGGGKMLDPWNSPYKVTIKKVSISPQVKVASGSMQTGYFLPNKYRLSEEER